MKSYGQFCALARALDVVGDRWTLLVVRELMVGARRFRDLEDGLPGVATNLLAERLRRLEGDGLVERASGAYRLTARGDELAPVVRALIRWGAPLMLCGRQRDEFRFWWLVPALGAILEGREAPPGVVEVVVGEARCHLVSDGRSIVVVDGPRDAPGARLDLDTAEMVLAVAAGARSLPRKQIEGDVGLVEAMLGSKVA